MTALLEGGIIDEDGLGNPIYGPPTEAPFLGEFRPLAGSEPPLANRDLVVTRFRVFLPASVAIKSSDKVVFRGDTYAVIGEPEPHNIGGRIHHYEVVVERTAG